MVADILPNIGANHDADFAPKPVELDANGEPVKKRRGRPPGSKNKTYAGQPVGARRGARGSLKTQIGAMLVTFNMPLMLVPALQRDALDHNEIEALAEAIDAQCQVSPTFRKYVEQALKVQGGTSLIGVVGIIAGRRVIRHDLVPVPDELGGNDGMDAMLGSLLPLVSGQAKPITFPTPTVEPAAVS